MKLRCRVRVDKLAAINRNRVTVGKGMIKAIFGVYQLSYGASQATATRNIPVAAGLPHHGQPRCHLTALWSSSSTSPALPYFEFKLSQSIDCLVQPSSRPIGTETIILILSIRIKSAHRQLLSSVACSTISFAPLVLHPRLFPSHLLV